MATAFPSGRSSLAIKLADTREAVANGADEIDMVIDRGAFLSGRYQLVFDEIVAVKEACGSAHLKVILETGELVTYDNVRRASWLAMLAGADFIKTSTGKVSPASTLPVALVMLAGRTRLRRRQPGQGGRQGGRRHPYRQGRDQVPRRGQGDLPARSGSPPTCSGSVRPACSTTCSCSGPSRPPGATPAPTTSPSTDRRAMTFDYAPAPESRDVAQLRSSYGLFIGGEFVDPLGGDGVQDRQPGDRGGAGRGRDGRRRRRRAAPSPPHAGPYDSGWGRLPGRERAKYLFRIARLLQERSRELAVVETLDNGKPIRESRDVDIPLAAAYFFYYAGWADKLSYAGLGADPQPLGVAAQVIPWNFPLLMLAWKIAPALAAGNTVVLKPAETTPLTALLFAEICQQADLPPGVVNILTGAGETGRSLVAHPGVDKVAFTGSTEVGKEILRTLAGTPVPDSPSSSAARRPTSSSTTRPWTRRSRASSTASSSTRAMSAAPAHGCSYRSPCWNR